MNEKKWHRDDLVKYTSKTKPITFRCDEKYEGNGTAARELLKSMFETLVSMIPNASEKLVDYSAEISDIEKILAFDIRRSLQ
jgi:hypothetical protein